MMPVAVMDGRRGHLPAETPNYCVHFFRYLPLSLGMFMDCVRTRLDTERNELTARILSPFDALQQLGSIGPGVFLFSDYIWNVDAHLAVSAELKRRLPQSVMELRKEDIVGLATQPEPPGLRCRCSHAYRACHEGRRRVFPPSTATLRAPGD